MHRLSRTQLILSAAVSDGSVFWWRHALNDRPQSIQHIRRYAAQLLHDALADPLGPIEPVDLAQCLLPGADGTKRSSHSFLVKLRILQDICFVSRHLILAAEAVIAICQP